MKYYEVTTISRGIKETDVVQAENRIFAVKKVQRNKPNSTVTKSIEVPTPIDKVFKNWLKDLQKTTKKKIKMGDKVSSIRQIAVMTDAGIPITDTLDDIAKNTKNTQLKEVFGNISTGINSGKSLLESVRPYEDEFGTVTMAMTELGEKTGNISGSYFKLSEMMENMMSNRAKFKKAIRYPMITLSAMIIAFVVLIMMVVPKFKSMFEKFGAELPIPTQILMSIEYYLSTYGLYIGAALLATIFFTISAYRNNRDFQYKMDRMFLNKNFYLINKVVFFSSMYNYTLVFGQLVQAGIPVSDALKTSTDLVTNLYLREKLATVVGNIEKGKSLSESFQETEIFEDMLLQMIRAGETGGQLELMLEKVSGYYNMRFQDIIDNMSSYIEPIMMILIAGLVLLMALGIFMPMWDLGSAVNK